MAVAYWPMLEEQATENVCTALQPLLTSFSDEAGNPLTVPVRAEYSPERAPFPEVAVRVDLGDLREGFSNNLLYLDATNGYTARGCWARGSSVVLTVTARSVAEVRFLVDALRWNLLEYAAGLPVVQDGYEEAYLVKTLASSKIVVQSVQRAQYPPPDTGAARPEGQPFTATLAVGCDIWVTWTTPVYALSAAAVNQTVVPGDAGPVFVTQTVTVYSS